MYFGSDSCINCKHFCNNNRDGLECGCRAFPNNGFGIPDGIRGGVDHSLPIEGQVGDYVFEPYDPEEVPDFFKWLRAQRGK